MPFTTCFFSSSSKSEWAEVCAEAGTGRSESATGRPISFTSSSIAAFVIPVRVLRHVARVLLGPRIGGNYHADAYKEDRAGGSGRRRAGRRCRPRLGPDRLGHLRTASRRPAG